jgi:RND family efflux transporter MFP subunit
MKKLFMTYQTSHNSRKIGRKLRRFAILLLAVLVVGFVITHVFKSSHEHTLAKDTKETASAPPLVEAVTVKSAPANTGLILPGETAAWYESTIYARVDGYVANWSADIGDDVKKGQVLATIETPELDAQLVAAKAKLVAAQAAATLAQTTYKRWKDSPKGVVSEQEREEKKANYASAQAQVALAQADVNRYEALTQFKQVTAPFDGRIIERRIDIGNLVTAGSNASTTPLYRIAQNNPMRIFVDAPQATAASMKKGVEVKIHVSTLPGREFTGTIARTADAINTQSRTLRVEVDLPNKDQALVSGMYVDIAFALPAEGLIEIPAAALIFRTSGPEVAVIDQNHQVQFRKVTIARDNGSTLEISSGLSIGDQVALNLSTQVIGGEVVQVSSSSEQAKESDGHASAK